MSFNRIIGNHYPLVGLDAVNYFQCQPRLIRPEFNKPIIIIGAASSLGKSMFAQQLIKKQIFLNTNGFKK